MGRGSYTASDWTKLRKERNLNENLSAQQIFSRSGANSGYISKNVFCRVSRDPDKTKAATPVIIGFDVTASMGYLAKELATNSINQAVTHLLSGRQISDPQVLCAAIGDCKSDRYPLQVTQFESDIRMVSQLLELHLEGGGGGNDGESYNLLWYFAAHHTRHDHKEKRNKKGYLFTIGDDRCHSGLLGAEIARNFPAAEVYATSNEALILQAREKYHLFHIQIERGVPQDGEIFYGWSKLLPGGCAPLGIRDVDCLAELIATIIAVTEGKQVREALAELDPQKAVRIAGSMAHIRPAEEKKTISF